MATIDDIVQFSLTHPWQPAFPPAMLRRFLTDLISSEKLIFDLSDSQGRLACAVLLDRVENPANDACLEILGVRQDVEPIPYVLQMIDWCKALKPMNRKGFQVGLHERSPVKLELLQARGLTSYYSTYEMRNSALKVLPLPDASQIRPAEKKDCDEVYKVLTASFTQNLETSIPDLAAWTGRFNPSGRSTYFLWRENADLVAFAHMIESDLGDIVDIHTIGVLPSHRGTGLGRKLLQHCINESVSRGYSECHLTVSATNEKALVLYERAGFKVTDKYGCFRMDFVR